MEKNKFKNSKIYAIKSNQTDKIYIGSTTGTISKRFSGHKYKFLKGNSQCLSREILKYDDAYIEILYNYPCYDKIDLWTEEKNCILLNKDLVINHQIPTNDKKEYLKEWRLKNKDNITQYNKDYYRTKIKI